MSTDHIIDIDRLLSFNLYDKNTKVVLYNGELKKISKLTIGDKLIDHKSKSNMVTNMIKGTCTSYAISHIAGYYTFHVNEDYIIPLIYIGTKHIKNTKDCFIVSWFNNISIREEELYVYYNEFTKESMYIYCLELLKAIPMSRTCSITVLDYLQLPEYMQNKLQLIRTRINFPNIKMTINPYVLGGIEGINLDNMIDYMFINKNCIYNSMETQLLYLAGVIDGYGDVEKEKYILTIMFNKTKLNINSGIHRSLKDKAIKSQLPTYAKDLLYLIQLLGYYYKFKKINDNMVLLYIFGNNVELIPTKKIIMTHPTRKYYDKIKIKKNNNTSMYGIVLENYNQYITEHSILTAPCY